jgi:hypothetical protein
VRGARDDLADKKVTSIALEVAAACLVAPGGADPVIGAWTTASVPQARLINPAPSTTGNASREGGAWTQVSRLGMPLVNEVVIGLKDKDRFNHSRPSGDTQFLTYVTNPTLPALVETLFAGAGVKAPTNFPRNDLVTVFLTGVAGLNQPAKVTPSEMLRLNTTIAAVPKGAQKRLGVIDGDNAGFPNGRRPGDDVVDIELRVAMGKLCTLNLGCAPANAPSGAIRFTDGAYLDDGAFNDAFPYLTTPIPGSPQSVAWRRYGGLHENCLSLGGAAARRLRRRQQRFVCRRGPGQPRAGHGSRGHGQCLLHRRAGTAGPRCRWRTGRGRGRGGPGRRPGTAGAELSRGAP